METITKTPVNQVIEEISLIPSVMYVRVSTDLQDYQRQIDDINEYSKKNDIKILEIFGEKESGKNKVRPELTKLLEYIEKNKHIENVVISELSRLGRTNEVLKTIDLLNDKKVCLISLKENNLKTLNPDKTINQFTSFTTGILSIINTFEIDTLKYRVKSELKKKMLNGDWVGSGSNLPYGYFKNEDKKILPEPFESEIVKKIFQLYLEGNGTKKISYYLNDNGIKPRNKYKWVDGVIYCMITNPIYCGNRRYIESEEIIEGRKTPKVHYEIHFQKDLQIIPIETFEKVQQMLKDNSTRQGINKKHDYYLDSKKIVCGVCGKNFYPYRKFINGTETIKDNRFVCITKRNRTDEKCDNYGIGIDKVEKLVQLVILERFKDTLVSKLDSSIDRQQIELNEEEIKVLNIELKKVLNKESNRLDLYEDGQITKELYIQRFKESSLIKSGIQSKIDRLEKEIKEKQKDIEDKVDIKKIEKRFKKKISLDKIVVNKIIKKIVITKENNTGQFFDIKEKIVSVKLYSVGECLEYFLSQRNNDYIDISQGFIKKSLGLNNYHKI